MIVSTTTALEGTPVSEYVGVVTGEAVLGANAFRDLFAGLRDIVGGRSAGYESSLREARDTAIAEMVSEAEQMGADAVVGVDDTGLDGVADHASGQAVVGRARREAVQRLLLRCVRVCDAAVIAAARRPTSTSTSR
jgi:uncharacterized protein YbjQ (UPF0145 family)